MPATTPQLTVRPSGFARSVVQGWMNAQDEERAASGQVSDMHTEEEEEVVELEARPDRLGLGAKFLSHNRAMLTSTTNAVGAQLSKKLRRYQPDEGRDHRGGAAEGGSGHERKASGPHARLGLGMQPLRKLNWSKQPAPAAHSDSDEEGESRSAALSASKRRGTVTAKGSLLTKPSKKQRKGDP